MSRYYTDYLIHSYDYSEDSEFDYEYEEPNEYEILNRYWDDSFEHSGIKGMHWGQRRYQNEDGSYTEAGMVRRYGHGHLNGARHYGNSKSSYRTGARSSSQQSKRKGLSTGAKVALAAAGLAAVGATGYALAKRGRKVHDAQSEGWDARKNNEYQRRYNEKVDEFNKAQSEWEKTRKVHGEGQGYRITDQGDPEARRIMEEAKNRAKSAGNDLIRYRDLNPEAVAKLRKEHKIGTTLQDIKAGVNDIKRNGLIDKSHKVTSDSLNKNFSNAFDKKGNSKLDDIKQNVSDKINSMKRSGSDRVTSDSLNKNFSNAFNKKDGSTESRKTINIGVGSKEINDTLKRNADRYNEVANEVNNRIRKMNADRAARGENPTNFPNSNLQVGPNMQTKPQTQAKPQSTASNNASKQTSVDKPKSIISDKDFETFDKMMSDPNYRFSLEDGIDGYTQELLKRNRKTINSMGR